MRVLLIIPAYNEEENILEVCQKVSQFGDNIDYIVVNDGSTDRTLEILEENNLNHLNLYHNLGIGGAVQTGYKYARDNGYDIAIQFDGDGQHDAEYIKTICEPIEKGEANMVVGTRYLDKEASEFQSTFMRRLGSNILSTIIKATCNEQITDPTSGFRAVDKNIIKLFADEYPTEYPEPESNVSVLRRGFKVKEVPVNMMERQGGKSSIGVLKSMDYMIKVSAAIIIDRFRKRES